MKPIGHSGALLTLPRMRNVGTMHGGRADAGTWVASVSPTVSADQDTTLELAQTHLTAEGVQAVPCQHTN